MPSGVGGFLSAANQYGSGLAEANAVLDQFTDPETYTDFISGFIPPIDQCVSELVIAAASAQTFTTRGSRTSKALGKALLKPIKDISDSFSTIFNPEGFDPEALAGGDYVKGFLLSVMESIKNPFISMINTQRLIAAESLEQISDIFTQNPEDAQGRGVVQQYSDRVRTTIKSFFFTDDPENLNIGSLVVFAIQEAIPAIEAELGFLSRMKRLLRASVEDVSSLPATLSLELPNIATVSKLCDAERWLRQTENRLRNESVWDRTAFGKATDAVCQSRDLLRTGTTGDLNFGLNVDIGDIAGKQFLPTVTLKFNLAQLNFLNGVFIQEDDLVREFCVNLSTLIDTILSFTDGNLVGDIMAIMVQLVRRQVSGVRRDLESQSRGFNGYTEEYTAENFDQMADNPAYSRTVRQGAEMIRDGVISEQRSDVYAYLSAQANAYTILSAMCFVMDKAEGVYRIADRLLKFETRVMKAVRGFVGRFDIAECGDIDGGVVVSRGVSRFIEVVEDRLNGGSASNQQIYDQGQRTLRAIDAREKFLRCVRSQLFQGNDEIAAAITLVTSALGIATNVAQIIRRIRELYKTYQQLEQVLKTLDLRRLFGLDALELDVLDTLVRAIQCLVLQCDNRFIGSLANQARQVFEPQQGLKKSLALSMNALDELPATAGNLNLGARVSAIFRLIRQLQSLTSLDINKLCEVQVSATQDRLPTITDEILGIDPGQVVATDELSDAGDRQAELTRLRQAYSQAVNGFQSSQQQPFQDFEGLL